MNCYIRKLNAIISLRAEESVFSNSDQNAFDAYDIPVKNLLVCHNVKEHSLQRPVR